MITIRRTPRPRASRETVSTHLYKIFTKLGITSRAALRDALEGLTPEEEQATEQPDDIKED
ncbi:hypothetical protein [Planotetraspora sp. GP83]|uniref:hypothetical protein n=1 Tax=Planotetraspora sp. GP83 TaxID=3156264 RepID=UPI0035115867